MPKLKTIKALTSRLRVTRKGKLIANPTGKRHWLQNKSRKKKRQLSDGHVFKETSLTKRVKYTIS